MRRPRKHSPTIALYYIIINTKNQEKLPILPLGIMDKFPLKDLVKKDIRFYRLGVNLQRFGGVWGGCECKGSGLYGAGKPVFVRVDGGVEGWDVASAVPYELIPTLDRLRRGRCPHRPAGEHSSPLQQDLGAVRKWTTPPVLPKAKPPPSGREATPSPSRLTPCHLSQRERQDGLGAGCWGWDERPPCLKGAG